MNTSRRRIAADAVGRPIVAREAPPEIQLWNPGENPTDYGVHVWNERSVAEVLARYTERGNPLLIDVEHNGATLKDGEPTVTGGYARLELRAGAPWLIFDWSDYGRAQIASGERRFLSPEYDVDKNTGEILALYRVSLVADPGTHRARMLATAGRGKMDLKVVLAALRAALAAEDPAVTKESITNLLTELDKSAGGEGSGDGTPDPAMADADPGKPADPMAAAAGDDEDADKDKEKEKTKAGAKAQPKPAPVAAKPTPKADGESKAVTAAAHGAVAQIKAAQRDHLIQTQGDKLEPSLRRWASAQPLEVVESFLAAIPAKETATTRTKATRGNGTASGLSERELAKCKAKNVDPEKYAANKQRMGG